MSDYSLLACIGGVFSLMSIVLGVKIKNKLAVRLGTFGLILFTVSVVLDIYLSIKHGGI